MMKSDNVPFKVFGVFEVRKWFKGSNGELGGNIQHLGVLKYGGSLVV